MAKSAGLDSTSTTRARCSACEPRFGFHRNSNDFFLGAAAAVSPRAHSSGIAFPRSHGSLPLQAVHHLSPNHPQLGLRLQGYVGLSSPRYMPLGLWLGLDTCRMSVIGYCCFDGPVRHRPRTPECQARQGSRGEADSGQAQAADQSHLDDAGGDPSWSAGAWRHYQEGPCRLLCWHMHSALATLAVMIASLDLTELEDCG